MGIQTIITISEHVGKVESVQEDLKKMEAALQVRTLKHEEESAKVEAAK